MEVRIVREEYSNNPHMNMAVDEAIFREVESGRSPTTLRFYQNRNAVIIGCFQLAEQEIDQEYAKTHDITVAKRFTGGGAVYHDMGNLNFSVISRDHFGVGLNVESLFTKMMGGAKRALDIAGLPDVKIGMNDATSKGKKVMGAAATMKKGVMLFHAALLVDTNLQTLASVLKVPGIKLKDKGVQTILERVTNIKEICGKGIEEIRKAVIEGYASEFDFSYSDGKLTDNEIALVNKLYREKYSKHGWNLGSEFITVSD